MGEEVRKRYIEVDGKIYSAWVCPRCVGGTMVICQDKANSRPYFCCVACGKKVRISEKFEKKREDAPKFVRKTGKKGKNKDK